MSTEITIQDSGSRVSVGQLEVLDCFRLSDSGPVYMKLESSGETQHYVQLTGGTTTGFPGKRWTTDSARPAYRVHAKIDLTY